MKNLVQIIVATFLVTTTSLFASGVPTIGTVTSNIIQKGTGDNYIIVGGISDGDASLNQNVTITAISTNNSVLSVTGVEYVQGRSFAIIKVKEFGVDGQASINVTASDPDAIENKSFLINVGFFYQKGARWSIYDIVFWQNAFPADNEPSKLDSIIPLVELPRDTRIWAPLNMTAGPIQLGSAFAAHDGYTTGYRGVMIPTASGVYMFTMHYQDGGECRFTKSSEFSNPLVTNSFRKRSEGDPQIMNDTIHMVAGRQYAFKCAYWTVFSEDFALQYAYLGVNPSNVTTVSSANFPTPGRDNPFLSNNTINSKNYSIPGLNASPSRNRVAGSTIFKVLGESGELVTYPYYDLIKPSAISGLTLLRKGSDRMEFKWNNSSDATGIKNYNLYIDGKLTYSTKTDKQTNYNLLDLSPGRQYSIFVTAVDKAGNESDISNVLVESTPPIDNSASTRPSNLQINVLADMSARVSWSPAIDSESGIFGYIVSVDGVLYNKDTLNGTSIILKTFQPLSTHSFSVVALNGNLVPSMPSTALGFTTVAYDPLLTSPGVKKLRMNVSREFVGKIDGFGLNAGWSDYSTTRVNDVRRINPGLLRWGALEANAVSYAAASSNTQPYTYAKFVNFANRVGSAVSIVLGTDGNPLIDWRNESLVGVSFGVNTVQMAVMERTAQQMIAYLFAPDSMAVKSIAGENFFPYHADVRKRLNERFRQSTFTGINSPFKSLIIELGNEVWGGTSNGRAGETDHNSDGFDNYTTYGIWARKMARAFKSSPYFDTTKIKISYSMREPRPSKSFGLTEAILAPTADADLGDLLSPAGYMGGNLNYSPEIPAAESELGYYRNSHEYMFDNLNGFYETKTLDNTLRKKQRGFFLYESAMTRSTYNQRMGQAITLTDYLLSAHKAGSYYPGLFSYEGGEWGMTSNNFTTLNPMFRSALLINNVTKGNRDVLNTSVTTFERVINDVGDVITSGSNFLEPVSTNIYHKNGVYSLVLVSRDFVEDFQVQLNFPSGMLLTPTVTGARKFDFRTPGDFSSLLSTVTSSPAVITNNMLVTVPKHAMVVFTFNGEVLPENKQLLGFSDFRHPAGFDVIIENLVSPNSLAVTTEFGSISFVASVTGGVASTTAIGWNISKPDSVTSLDIVYDVKSIRLNALDCNSDGIITVTSFLMKNPNRSLTFVVTISGQISENGTPCDPITKVAKEALLDKFDIYPNPSTGAVSIQTGTNGVIRISNAQGLMISTIDVNANSNEYYLNFEPGLYFATFTNSKGSITKKIIISR